MKYILIIILTLFCSCSNLNLYRNIEDSANDYNNNHDNNKIIISKNGYNPTRKIFHKLKRKLKNDSILYIFSWDNNILKPKNNNSKALVFNELSQTYYYVNLESNNLKISQDSSNFYEERKILKEYNNDRKLLSIKKYQNQFSSSELGTNFYIFDLKNCNIIFLQSIVFDKDGNFLKF